MPDIHTVSALVRILVSLAVLGVLLLLLRRSERSHWYNRLFIATSVLSLTIATLGLVGRIGRAGIPVRVVPAASLVSEVRSSDAPTLALVLYNPSCGRCERVIGAIVEYAGRRERNELGLIAVSFPGDPDRVRRFVLALDARVEGVQLAPYPSGSLVASLKPLGAKLPMRIGSPYVILLDERRSAVAEWEAMERLADFGAVVDSLRDAREARSRTVPLNDAGAGSLAAMALHAVDSATVRP
jgi:hypothetical protein